MSQPLKRVKKVAPAVSQSATAARNDPEEPEEDDDVPPWTEVIWLRKKPCISKEIQR
jgi:hypothetical protein